jgi:hypothetical protein
MQESWNSVGLKPVVPWALASSCGLIVARN